MYCARGFAETGEADKASQYAEADVALFAEIIQNLSDDEADELLVAINCDLTRGGLALRRDPPL